MVVVNWTSIPVTAVRVPCSVAFNCESLWVTIVLIPPTDALATLPMEPPPAEDPRFEVSPLKVPVTVDPTVPTTLLTEPVRPPTRLFTLPRALPAALLTLPRELPSEPVRPERALPSPSRIGPPQIPCNAIAQNNVLWRKEWTKIYI